MPRNRTSPPSNWIVVNAMSPALSNEAAAVCLEMLNQISSFQAPLPEGETSLIAWRHRLERRALEVKKTGNEECDRMSLSGFTLEKQ